VPSMRIVFLGPAMVVDAYEGAVGSRGAEYAGLRALCASCYCVRLPCGGMPRFTQISKAEVTIDSVPLQTPTSRHHQHHQHHSTNITGAPKIDLLEVKYSPERSRVNTHFAT
jgi:hypothetical protein